MYEHAIDAEVDTFTQAAHWADEVVRRIPATVWEGPGLGDWNLLALVGHTSRALLTVEHYLERPAPAEQITSAAEYYEQARTARTADATAIVQRGIDAGAALGDDPAAAFHSIVERVSRIVADADDEPIVTIVGGMRLGNYLATRTFELVVHGLDIGAAAHLDQSHPPEEALRLCLDLATTLAIRSGDGQRILLALTGRGGLEGGYSALPG